MVLGAVGQCKLQIRHLVSLRHFRVLLRLFCAAV